MKLNIRFTGKHKRDSDRWQKNSVNRSGYMQEQSQGIRKRRSRKQMPHAYDQEQNKSQENNKWNIII